MDGERGGWVMMEVWIWIGKEQKVIMDDAGTNRLVFSSPFSREGGRERHSHTHITGPWW